MKQQENYVNAGWDFDDIWEFDLDKNYGYAFLQILPNVPITYRPRELNAELIDNYFSLAWAAPLPGSTGTFIGYKIYRDGVFIGDTTSLSFVDMDVENAIEYEYYITAVYVNPEGETAASNIVTIFIGELPDFEPPTNLVAIAGNTEIYLSWDSPVVMDNGEWRIENGHSFDHYSKTVGNAFIRSALGNKNDILFPENDTIFPKMNTIFPEAERINAFPTEFPEAERINAFPTEFPEAVFIFIEWCQMNIYP